jgi:uncharacterized protein (DUF2147 family)
MRINSRSRAALTVAGLMVGACVPATAQRTPRGSWNTISDQDGRATATVQIADSGGVYRGTVRALLVPAEPNDSVCGRCSGDRRGRRIVGMEILSGMHHVGDSARREWGGGEILDPETGKTYKAIMTLSDDGQTLTVRGYIGFSVFGRSQKWKRAESATMQER